MVACAPFSIRIVRFKSYIEKGVKIRKYRRMKDARTACICPSVCLFVWVKTGFLFCLCLLTEYLVYESILLP